MVDHAVEGGGFVLAVGINGESDIVGADVATGEHRTYLLPAGTERRREAAVLGEVDDCRFRLVGDPAVGDFRRRVAGAVVDDDDTVDAGIEVVEHGLDGGRLVVGGHDSDTRRPGDPGRRVRMFCRCSG